MFRINRKTAAAFALSCSLVLPFGHLLAQESTPQAPENIDLSGVKSFLVSQTAELKDGAAQLQADSDAFYDLAKAANFDYAALWQEHQADVVKLIKAAQSDWITISPIYEQMEGIVAGVPLTNQYDTILDAGEKGDTGYDVALPDGTVLPQPGNLFGLLETTLSGTDKDSIVDMAVDFDGSGTQDFGEVMPNANLLKGYADAMSEQSAALLATAETWEPTPTDVFTALVMNVPTMSDFFNSWKTSRFVMGDEATHEDFAVISRLSDIVDNVGSWQVMWDGLSPVVTVTDASRSAQVESGLGDLHSYVADLFAQEKGGKRVTPEDADIFSSEAQDRATAIVGQIAQVAAEINVELPQ